MKYTAAAMIHSTNQQDTVTVLYKATDKNDYIVITPQGTACHAIYNPFTGLYYADDIYGIVKGGDQQC